MKRSTAVFTHLRVRLPPCKWASQANQVCVVWLAKANKEFGKPVTPAGSFPRIPHAEAMLKYGSDKPDLRNPLLISDVTEAFKGSSFGLFAKNIEKGAVVRAIPAPGSPLQFSEFIKKEIDTWGEVVRATGTKPGN